MILHFAVGGLQNHMNANLFQSIKHTVQHYDQNCKLSFFVENEKKLTYAVKFIITVSHRKWKCAVMKYLLSQNE